MMGMVGTSEWLLIFGVMLLLFGPSKLPLLGSSLGQAIRNFRKGLNEISKEQDPSPSSKSEDEKN